jgi:hypothetical protein
LATDKENSTALLERLNYFNYFTEIEEEFVRRRGKPLLISPMDWALIESWKNAGIPLHVVLRAINQAFDAYDARARKYRKVNSVFYCQQEVESMFADYRLAQVGAGADAESHKQARGHKRKAATADLAPAFPKPVLMDFVARSDRELAGAAMLASRAERQELEAAVERARARLSDLAKAIETSALVDTEAVEKDLDGIDRMLLGALKAACGEAGLARLRAEADGQLQSYRKKMDRSIYDQTVENFVSRRLRESFQVPRLSLFYI